MNTEQSLNGAIADQSKIRIIFTENSKPISDFWAEHQITTWLIQIENHIDGQYKQKLEIRVCNVLLFNMLRAAYYTTHSKYQEYTTWWYEDNLVDMDKDMRSKLFWQMPKTDLEETALMKLLNPDPQNG